MWIQLRMTRLPAIRPSEKTAGWRASARCRPVRSTARSRAARDALAHLRGRQFFQFPSPRIGIFGQVASVIHVRIEHQSAHAIRERLENRAFIRCIRRPPHGIEADCAARPAWRRWACAWLHRKEGLPSTCRILSFSIVTLTEAFALLPQNVSLLSKVCDDIFSQCFQHELDGIEQRSEWRARSLLRASSSGVSRIPQSIGECG